MKGYRCFAVLEVSWLASLFVFVLVRMLLGAHSTPESIAFIHQHGPTYAVVSVWLSNSSSAFLLTALSILHPTLAVAGVACVALAASSRVTTAWLTGVCATPHMVYSIVEAQVFILIAWMGLVTRNEMLSSKSLTQRWNLGMKEIAKLALLVLALYLVLATAEVVEVLAHG